VEVLLTREPEHDLDALVLQARHQELGDGAELSGGHADRVVEVVDPPRLR
jgi:hypothetical protein